MAHHDKKPALGKVGTVRKISPKRRGARPVGVILVGIALLVTSTSAVVWGYNRFFGTDSNKQICSSNLLERASVVLEPQKSAELLPVVDEIKALPNYQTDPNCVAVVAAYYVNTGNITEGQASYGQLTAVFSPDVGYNPIIVGKVLTPEQLLPALEFLEQQAKSVLENNGGQYGGAFGDKKE